MTGFAVLDRDCKVHQNLLLEASAGTGKTFSIENMVVRLLIEEPALDLDRILIVTFTKAATAELKARVRARLVEVVELFRLALRGSVGDSTPDYLGALIEKGEEAIQRYIVRLEEFLFTFEDAQIFTIHGFCSQMLREFPLEARFQGPDGAEEEETIGHERQLAMLRDFFRTELSEELICPAQLQLLLRRYGLDVDRMGMQLLREAQRGTPVAKQGSFQELFDQAQEAFSQVRAEGEFSSDRLISDFCALAPCYKKVCTRAGDIQPKIDRRMRRDAELLGREHLTQEVFEEWIRNGLVYSEALDPDQIKVKAKYPESLHYPDLQERLRAGLGSIVSRARNVGHLVAAVAGRLQALLYRMNQELDLVTPDTLLDRMAESIQSTDFLKAVQGRFDAVVVDEFQDTDPLQWQIFSGLFLDDIAWKGQLYLVGDPKQSIYAFRNADIYTYLKAVKSLGEEAHRVLDTNYRSQQGLVSALNSLFLAVPEDQLFELPLNQESVAYRAVHAGIQEQLHCFDDGKGDLHFFVGEGKLGRGKRWPSQELEAEQLAAFIGSEIHQLVAGGCKYQDCAILVRDRFQAERMASHLRQEGIPFVVRRTERLTDSPMYGAMKDLLRAAVQPRHLAAFRTFLVGIFGAWSDEQLKEAEDDGGFDQVIAHWRRLSRSLFEHGFSVFFERLMQSSWLSDGRTIAEQLLARSEALYQAAMQLAELAIEHQYQTRCSAEGLISFFDGLERWENLENERLQMRQDHSVDAVVIMTLHVSKGLEFPIVFALGLVNRTPQKELLIRSRSESGDYLVPSEPGSAEHEAHILELDAEKLRQLYVAMTRAKWRLYVPVAVQEDLKVLPEEGSAAPLELLFSKLGLPHNATLEVLKERLESLDSAGTISVGPALSAEFAVKGMDQVSLNLAPVPDCRVPGQELRVESFTSLASHSTAAAPLESPPLDEVVDHPTRHNLPAGPLTGTLVHEIFEKIDLAKLDQLASLVDQGLEGSRLGAWRESLLQMLEDVLRAPLQWKGQEFSLSDVNPEKIFPEMEFLFKDSEQRLIKGFIDLVFEYEGFIHIVDWKTNWLGPEFANYDQASLEQAMCHHDYHLQASLYSNAIQRYLNSVQGDRPGPQIGAVYYLFVRGVDGESPRGVYRWDPQEEGRA